MLARDNTSLIVAYFGRVYYGLSNGFRWASQADASNAIKNYRSMVYLLNFVFEAAIF